MPYSQKIDRLRPGCFIFLLDQSDSMNDTINGTPGVSKAEALADIVNDTIATIMRRCFKERGERAPRPYYNIGVVGYSGEDARSLFGGELAGRWLVTVPELYASVLRKEQRHGYSRPVWFEPFADDVTPMCEALDTAGRLASGWARGHPDSFPPIVINITDGQASDGTPEDVQMWAGRLQSVRTNDGNLLLFNISVSGTAQKMTKFPSSESELGDDDFARLLFRTSSELPPLMRECADRLGTPTGPGARGFVSNATPDAVVLALTVGTNITQPDARQGG
jgi:hypothetical protein